MKRSSRYSLLKFREDLVRDLIGLEEIENPPVYCTYVSYSKFHLVHLPKFGDKRKNCEEVCYTQTNKKEKVFSYCDMPQCGGVPLHCTSAKNCFAVWHSSEFHFEN